MDRIVFTALMMRSWQALSGLVSVLLIVHYFHVEVQGFYYTFASLLALQWSLELGLYLVIVTVVSHEWAHLELRPDGTIAGDANARSRLISFGRFIFKWYAVVSAIFVVAVGTAGYVFFSLNPHTGVDWQAPWFVVVVLTGLVLWTIPYISLLEGCNQVAAVNRFRLVQISLSNGGLWLTIILGGDLWAAAVSAAINLACSLYVLLVRYRGFFKPFYSAVAGPRILWKTEVWPMQWRLALQGIVSFFMYSLFSPVMFHYHGAAVAGQMGVTVQLANMLLLLTMAWIQTRAPSFGVLIARRDYSTLDHLWKHTFIASITFALVTAALLWLVVYLMNVFEVPQARRLLGPLPTGLFIAATVLTLVIQCQNTYLRAHKMEPLVWSGVASAASIGVLVWWLGSQYGPTGAASANFLVISLLSLPLSTFIWRRLRAKLILAS